MKQYSFYSVDLLIDLVAIEGFSDSNAIISAGRSSPQHGKVMDARGKMIAITSADFSGLFSFDLLQTSDSNQFLQELALASHQIGTSGNSATFVPIQGLINDKMGNTQVTGANGIISMQPAVTRGTGLATNTWTIEFERVDIFRNKTENTGV